MSTPPLRPAERAAQVRIRHGEDRDAVPLLALVAALNRAEGNPCLATAETLHRDLIGKAIVVVAEAPDGTLIGYATGHATYETGHAEPGVYVGDLYVVPERRREGIARALLAAMARSGHAQGARHLWLTARETNGAAHAFYRRLGSKGEPVMAFAVVQQDFLNLAAEPPR
ncbi:GNAT family N-acetyltransferase [Roseomonas terrae]|uniref:GNAT family N-acetyltransferase n=1 Tax=Neoroseomonas terrae TaxID=424799 RepID=A0ABS5EPB2_9PROT|nr:GNAT family N-acetyltransferase [Neoroseomonas terrae]